MKRFIFALCLPVFLSGCTQGGEPLPEKGIVISEAIVRSPMGGQNMTAGYFQVTNHTNIDDALISVESPAAERVEMHATEKLNNTMTMRRQISIDIEAGETLTFKPGGLHLMLFGVKMKQDQPDVSLTLKFKHAPDMTIIAEVAETVTHSGHH